MRQPGSGNTTWVNYPAKKVCFLTNGGDVFTLQQILGHSTLEMVKHYVNLASNHVAIQHQKYSPLDRLNLKK